MRSLAFVSLICLPGTGAQAADKSVCAKRTLKARVSHSEPAETTLAGGLRAGAYVAPKLDALRGIMPESAPGAQQLKAKIVSATRTRLKFLVNQGQFDEAERVVRCSIAAFPANNPLSVDLEQIRLSRATSGIENEDISTTVDKVQRSLMVKDAGCCGPRHQRGQDADIMGPFQGL